MQKSDYPKFLEIMNGLGLVFNRTIEKPLMEIYWRVLTPFPIEKIIDATDRIVVSRKYTSLPLPADFMSYLTGTSNDPEMKAMEAEKSLDYAFGRFSYSVSFWFKDRVIGILIHEYYKGWYSFYQESMRLTHEEYKWFKKEFFTRYKLLLNKQYPPDYNPKMIGLNEIENTDKGFFCLPNGNPLYIDGKHIFIDEPEAIKYLEEHREEYRLKPLQKELSNGQ